MIMWRILQTVMEPARVAIQRGDYGSAIRICTAELQRSNSTQASMQAYIHATMAEAWLGIGHLAAAIQSLDAAAISYREAQEACQAAYCETWARLERCKLAGHHPSEAESVEHLDRIIDSGRELACPPSTTEMRLRMVVKLHLTGATHILNRHQNSDSRPSDPHQAQALRQQTLNGCRAVIAKYEEYIQATRGPEEWQSLLLGVAAEWEAQLTFASGDLPASLPHLIRACR